MIRTRIKVAYGTMKRISEAENVPYTTLRDALDYKTDSIQAQSLRQKALTIYGGKKIRI